MKNRIKYIEFMLTVEKGDAVDSVLVFFFFFVALGRFS